MILSAGLAIYIPIYQDAVDDAQNIAKRLEVKDSNPTIIWSADNHVLYRVAAVQRKVIDLTDKQIPSYVRYALVAAEDRRFYDHRGVDPISLARAAFTTIRDRHSSSGGSTISMQLAKQMINGDARTPMRKLKDIATAQQIENLKSKDEILNLYANNAYYGEQAFGIQRAAQIYFGKDAKDLTVGEAAMLARCVRLPSRVNPVKSPDKMIDLRNYVLKVMLDEGWITQGQYDEGIREVPKIMHEKTYGQGYTDPAAGYFVQHVLSEFEDENPGVDYKAGGYQIHTTLNYKLQMKAIQSVRDVLHDNRGHGVNDGAIVVMDQYGQVLAEVGGPDYRKRQFNVITQGIGRQPGSAFKSIVYAVAMKNGVVHPGQMLSNARLHEKDGNRIWDPDNASPKENAPEYGLETAFALSVNRPAIWTVKNTGAAEIVKDAKDIFGIKSHIGATLSLGLGSYEVKPLEMLEAYSVFMLGGNRVEPQPIKSVTGPDGRALGSYSMVVHENVLDRGIAQQMDDLLKTPVAYGTATIARDVPNARGKTGTTNDAKDAWFCGYSDGLVGVGWVGNSSKNGSALKMSSRVFGGTVTVKIWRAVMLAAHDLNLANGVKTQPSTSVSVAPEPEVKPEQTGPTDVTPRHDVQPPLGPDPVIVTLPPAQHDPASDPDMTPPDGTTGDGYDPTKEPPIEADKVKPEKVKTEPVRPPEPPKKREPVMVEVQICVDTGMKASMYCPETVTRTFEKGKAPRRTCTLHHG